MQPFLREKWLLERLSKTEWRTWHLILMKCSNRIQVYFSQVFSQAKLLLTSNTTKSLPFLLIFFFEKYFSSPKLPHCQVLAGNMAALSVSELQCDAIHHDSLLKSPNRIFFFGGGGGDFVCELCLNIAEQWSNFEWCSLVWLFCLASSLAQSSNGSCGEHGCYERLISGRCTAMHRTVLVKFSSVFFSFSFNRGIRFVSFGGQSSVPLECFSSHAYRRFTSGCGSGLVFSFFSLLRPDPRSHWGGLKATI